MIKRTNSTKKFNSFTRCSYCSASHREVLKQFLHHGIAAGPCSALLLAVSVREGVCTAVTTPGYDRENECLVTA